MSTRKIRFSHVGFHVRELDSMVGFYCRHLGLQVTDRGRLTAVPGQPVTDVLDLALSDSEIHALTENRYAGEPDYQPIEDWRSAFTKRLEGSS